MSPRAALCRPIEERIAGQPPGSPPAMWKVSVAPRQEPSASSNNPLARERIPHSHADIVEVGPVRIELVHQVGSPQKIYGELQGVQPEAHSRAGFECVGPILAFRVDGCVPVPVDLKVFAE